MTEVKLAEKISNKAISELAAQLRQKEQELAKDLVSAGEKLAVTTAKIREQKIAAKLKLKDMQLWIKEINPNHNPFNPEDEHNTNCGSCALAVHLRLNGNKDVVAGRINIAPTDADMEELTGLKCEYMELEEIEEQLIKRGAGSELIIGINRTSGAGHWFNAFYDGEKIYTVDGQTGKIMDWPHDYGNVSAWCALI